MLVHCEVSRDGHVREARVIRSADCSRLDSAAREALLEARFEPAQKDRVAVDSSVEVPVVFHLE